MLIVYIDDDPDDREFFSDAINAIDPQISCVAFDSTASGIDFLKKEDLAADFIFIDINMPKMNGYESVREIRSINKLKNVAIVMLTTSLSSADVTDFHRSGIRVLIKPNRMEDLVHSLKSIFRQAGRMEEKQ